MRIPLPFAVKGRDVNVKLDKKTVRVALKGMDPILDGEFCNNIKVEDSTWTLEESKVVVLAIEKVKTLSNTTSGRSEFDD